MPHVVRFEEPWIIQKNSLVGLADLEPDTRRVLWSMEHAEELAMYSKPFAAPIVRFHRVRLRETDFSKPRQHLAVRHFFGRLRAADLAAVGADFDFADLDFAAFDFTAGDDFDFGAFN